MNPLDRKLATVYKALLTGAPDEQKRQKASKEFGQIRGRVVDAELGRRLELLFAEFPSPPGERRKFEAAESQEIIRDLLKRGFVETAALLFVVWLDVLTPLNQDEVLAIAPNVNCIKAWIKATRSSPRELGSRLLAKPVETFATAGADWLLESAKPDALLPLLDLFLTRQSRPSHLPTWKCGLVSALKMDKRGIFLSAVLNHQWPASESMATLAEAIRSNRSAFRTSVELLPSILARKDGSSAGVSLIGEMFGATVATDGADRELMTVLLARLGTGILLAESKTPQSESALEIIQNMNRQLRNITREEALQSLTWVFDNLHQEDVPAGGKLHVSTEGARYLALAFEKAAQGFAAKDILVITARNLGLSPFGKKGDEVKYDPLRHEDVDGGMLPGDSARIEDEGWAIGQSALIRAKAKRLQGERHV